MVRTEDGAEIQLEAWALPVAGFGDFVANVLTPLAIGTVAIADGRAVKGFIVEPSGIGGAQEITALGGWRACLDWGQAA